MNKDIKRGNMKQLNVNGYTAEEVLLDALERVRANPELNKRHMSTQLLLVVGTDGNNQLLSTFTYGGASTTDTFDISHDASTNIMSSALAAMGETDPSYVDTLSKLESSDWGKEK